ncbi:hypothetical protein SESBI_33079 [Sesbania bispinosa]|nr:hypothetical protein SESBI_33079 [Sesbania bispinosa]
MGAWCGRQGDGLHKNPNVWVQLWGLHTYCRTKQMGHKIGEHMGPIFDADVFEIQGRGPSVKVLMELDCNSALIQGDMVIKRENRGEDEEGDESFGSWMKVGQLGRREVLKGGELKLLNVNDALSGVLPDGTTTIDNVEKKDGVDGTITGVLQESTNALITSQKGSKRWTRLKDDSRDSGKKENDVTDLGEMKKKTSMDINGGCAVVNAVVFMAIQTHNKAFHVGIDE